MNRASLTSSSPPTIEFWEDKLETRAARLLSASHKPDFINSWIQQRSPTEISVLRSLVGLPVDISAKGRVQELLRYADGLRHFVPVVAFGFYKSVLATLEVAEGCVPEELRQLAAKSGGTYDTTALLFTIYDQSPEELENVFLLDKLHRVGLAPMKLRRTPRHPARPLSAFLRSDAVRGVLERFDREQRDGRRCTLRKVLDRDGGYLVFIRRPHRPTHQLVDDRVVHGHTADWIVLEYRDEGRLLNVASHGKKSSFIIANQIASAFFEAPCEYVNVEEVVFPAQLQRFLEQLAGDEASELTLVAAELRGLPLRGFDTLGVVCANPNDRDFPPRDPDCRGIIELAADADEGGGDYACPVCDRIVYPNLTGKEQCRLLTATLDQEGIERFVLQQFGPGDPELVFERGVLVVPGRPQNRFICIVDFCTDPTFLDRGWIEPQLCVYIVVDPRVRLRLDAAHHARLVELVDLLYESVTLRELLSETLRVDPYSSWSAPALPIRRAELPRRPLDERMKNDASRKFAVGLHDSGVVVEGTVIECDSSALPYLSFSELMQQAASDVGSGREITPLTARKIAERIKEKLPAATVDPDTVQKALKRLDQSIVEVLRQAGFSVAKGEVIENVARAGKYRGQHGFRLNSDKVLLEAKASIRAGVFEATATMSDSTRARRKSRR